MSDISRRQFLIGAIGAVAIAYGLRNTSYATNPTVGKVVHTDAEWRKILTPNQYYILRQAGTDPPFNNEYWNTTTSGDYICAGCSLLLFHSAQKYDSGEGWPSFWAPASKDVVTLHQDNSLFEERTEVRCTRCDGHLGHLFNDGPQPTGLRYCIDSGALKLVPKK